jgi:DNA topoisomerase-3
MLGGERFTARGLTITQKNFLEVFSKFEKWGEHSLPVFVKGQQYAPSLLMMRESRTEPPPLLSVSQAHIDSLCIVIFASY